jgi:hypothetical protein
MAILFDPASTEYLQIDSATVTTYPFTMAAWYYVTDANFRSIMFIGDLSSSSNYHELYVNGTDTVRARTRAGGANEAVTTTTGSLNNWEHACGVWTSATDRAAFLDGGGKGTETTSRTPTGIDRTSIGRRSDSSPEIPFNGRIAEAAIWSVALSDAEVALLAKGYSPLFIQPQNLAGYWPLIALGDIQDRVGDLNMTAFNTPVTAVHPPKIIYPAPPFISYAAAAAPPEGNAMPMAVHSYRQRRVAA